MGKTFLLRLLLQCTSLLLVQAASSELFEGDSYKTTFEGRGGGLVYSDGTGTPYFGETLSFNAIDGKILLGAADKLYIFNKNLTIDEGGVYSWSTSAGSCPNNGDTYVCRNHIRIYQRPSNNSDSLFVCGTQSGIQAQCRILNITNSSLVEAGQPSPTSLVSAHPDLPGFGEFRRGNSTDDVYFTANFRTTNPTSPGSYDISYQQVNISQDGAMVETERLYGWNQTSNFWLNSPVVFVDYRRVDAGTNEQNQFYFVFLRERVGEEIQSRVVRLCRNDAGVEFTNTRTNPPTSARIFNNYLKARIMCEREPPPGTRFVGAQDFNYNEMWSTAFNSPDGGRYLYHNNVPYTHMMYGAFSGPRIGPIGSAVCVYRASMMSDGLKRGLFDPFREDVRSSIDGTPIENMYINCEPEGRPSEFSQFVQAEHNVEQLVENPLLVADGFYITQMVVDQVCVVTRENAAACVNQDVLFLGTSDGRVLKVVFGTEASTGGNILPIFPIVAEEITLGDGNPVKEMQIDVVEGTKQLYVVTSTKVHRMPVEQCSRHSNDFLTCIGSRDPYCVWDATQSRCAYSNLTATGSEAANVPVYIRQNIHTGNVTLPVVRFDMESYTVAEGGVVSVTLTSDQVVGDGVVQVDVNNLTAKVGENLDSVSPISISFRQSSSNPTRYEATFTIPTLRDSVYKGDIQFELSLRNTIAGAVYFPQQNATVTITDIDGTLFRVGFLNLASTCHVWIAANRDEPNAPKVLSSEIAKALNLAETNIIRVTLNCSGGNDNTAYVTLLGVLLVTSDRTINDLLTSLQKWIEESPAPEIDSLNIEVDRDCSARIPSPNNTLCTPKGGVRGVSPPQAASTSTSTVTGLSVILVIVTVIAAVLTVAVILMGVVLWKAKRPHGCESSEVSPEVPEVKGTKMSQVNGHEEHYDDIVPNRLSLAERRGSTDLHLYAEPGESLPFTRDTLPKSSEPLLGKRFFSDSGEEHNQPDRPEELSNGVHPDPQTADTVLNISYGSVSPEPSFEPSEQVVAV